MAREVDLAVGVAAALEALTMAKETFDQMIARVTAKKSAPAPKLSSGPPPPPKLSPSPVTVPSGPKLK